MTTKKLKYKDYTIGWVTVLDSELNASILLLDEEHEPLAPKENDDNGYILGRIGAHNVAISFSGAGAYETNAAAHAVNNMLRTFPNIRFALLVGVGGGAPGPPNIDDPSQDIRLGDIVVSESKGDHGGVIQYDMGKWEDEGEFTIKSHLNKPPKLLLKAVKFLRSNHSFNKGEMDQYIEEATKKASGLPKLKGYRYPGCDRDRLYEASYRHAGGNDCSNCDFRMARGRSPRESKHTYTPEVHYGLIASAGTLVKSAQCRDKLRDRWNVSCFDTEAAGLMNNFPCVVIRGICDYSDGHKNRIWQPYAAIAAGAYAKDLLRVISTHEVTALPPALSLLSPNPWHNEVDTDQKTAAVTQKELVTSGLRERLRGILEKTEVRLLTLEENLASLSQGQDVLQKIEARLLALEENITSLSQPSPSTTPAHKPFPLEVGGKYLIINASSGATIDLSATSTGVIRGGQQHGGENQKWILSKNSNDQWTFMNSDRPVYIGLANVVQNGGPLGPSDEPFGWDVCQDDDLPFYFSISRPNNQRPDLYVSVAENAANWMGSPIPIYINQKYNLSDTRRNQKWVFLQV